MRQYFNFIQLRQAIGLRKSSLQKENLKPNLFTTETLVSFDLCAVSFIVGVCASLLCKNLLELSWLIAALICAALVSLRYRVFFPLFVMLLGLSWATVCFQQHYDQQLPIEFERKTIVLNGDVLGLPESNELRLRFSFRINTAHTQQGVAIAQLAKQTVLLSCYQCSFEILPQQQWRLSVRLKRPHSYASWGAFDYEKYLFRHKLLATGYVRLKDDNTLMSSGHSVKRFSIDRWRWDLRAYLQDTVSDTQAGLAIVAALMIGDKSLFTSEQREVLQKTGVSHLMAISGLHIGLAFFVIVFLLKWLLMPVARLFDFVPRQKMSLVPALAGAYLYAALAGFAISTQRAIIMLTLFVLVRLIAREVSLLKILIAAMLVILIYDPLSILDVGFWLSCSAVLIIALLSLKILSDQQSFELEAPKNNLRLVRLQPILWLGMLPLTLLFFGKVSLISPVINLFMVPLFSLLLIPATLFALVLKNIGLLELSDLLLQLLGQVYDWIYQCLAWFSRWKIAQLSLMPMTSVAWGLFILSAAAYFFVWRVRHCLAVCLIVIILLNSPKKLASDQFIVTLLDVGQGLSMVIEAADYVLVYDTGPSYRSGFNAADAVLIPYLHVRGIKKIDTLIISHADNDHIGGFAALQKSIDVEQILTSRTDVIPQATQCESGQHWSVAGIEFNILSPNAGTPQSSNNHSCVLSVFNGSIGALISGDIEAPVERYLLANNAPLQADILLVPHQGSKTSSTPEFIAAVDPSLALIAAGYANHYGHPHKDVVARYQGRGIALQSTIENGSIILDIQNNVITSTAYRDAEKGFWHRQKSQLNEKK